MGQQYLIDLRAVVKHVLKRGVKPQNVVDNLEIPKPDRKLGNAVYWKNNVTYVAAELLQKR